MEIDRIFEMIADGMEEETRRKGIGEGRKVRFLSVFCQPREGKRYWEGCAEILAGKKLPDEERLREVPEGAGQPVEEAEREPHDARKAEHAEHQKPPRHAFPARGLREERPQMLFEPADALSHVYDDVRDAPRVSENEVKDESCEYGHNALPFR